MRWRRVSAIAGAIACGAALLLWGAPGAGADPPTGSVTSYATATTGAAPTGLVDGPDGNLWFLEKATAVERIGAITTSGTAVDYPTGVTASPEPFAIISAGSGSGMLWFTETDGDFGALASITTSGTVTAGVRVSHNPTGIAEDAAGDLWIVSGTGENEVTEVEPPYTAVAAEVPLPINANANSIVVGPNGKTVWITEPGIDSVASVTPGTSLTVTQFPVTLATGTLGTLGDIVRGSDGSLWTGSVGVGDSPSAVLKVTPAGSITAFPLPAGSDADPDVLAPGPDGQLWMPDTAGTDGGLTSMTTSGTFASYPDLVPAADTISSIVRDPGTADALWLTDTTSSRIYRVALTPPPSPPPTPPTTPPTTPSPTTTTTPPPTPALTASLQPVADVTSDSVQLTGTITEPAGSATNTVSYFFEYGTTTAYGHTTPVGSASATPSGVAVTAPLNGLAPYTTYHYRLVASDCSSAGCQSTSPDESFTTGTTLTPEENTSVGVKPIAGTILIELPRHHRFERLPAGTLLPLGATVNARRGTVLLESAIGPGEVASGQFHSGVFTVTQPAGGTFTVLALDSSFAVCHPAMRATAASAKKRRPASKKVVNQVFGNAHGQFKTRGQYATAADEGTAWLTSDRCDGTEIVVSAGRVTVTNLVTHRTFVLTAPHHHLASPR